MRSPRQYAAALFALMAPAITFLAHLDLARKSASLSPDAPAEIADAERSRGRGSAANSDEGTAPLPASSSSAGGPLIPRKIWFTYKKNLLSDEVRALAAKTPDTNRVKILYNNVLRTIDAYEAAWNGTDVEVNFLGDAECVDMINRTQPELLPLFRNQTLGMYRGDICRAVAVYNHGGYYFDIDMEVIVPFVADPNVTFVSPVAAKNKGTELFNSFIAASPRHPILKRSLIGIVDFLGGKMCQGGMLGPCTLRYAYDHVSDEDRHGAVLLTETDLSWIPYTHGIQRRGANPWCNMAVHDPNKQRVHFYSRVVGSGMCKTIISTDRKSVV